MCVCVCVLVLKEVRTKVHPNVYCPPPRLLKKCSIEYWYRFRLVATSSFNLVAIWFALESGAPIWLTALGSPPSNIDCCCSPPDPFGGSSEVMLRRFLPFLDCCPFRSKWVAPTTATAVCSNFVEKRPMSCQNRIESIKFVTNLTSVI